MIALGKSQLTLWADTIGIPNLGLAEHDLRLTHALAGIYAEPGLKDILAFKGARRSTRPVLSSSHTAEGRMQIKRRYRV